MILKMCNHQICRNIRLMGGDGVGAIVLSADMMGNVTCLLGLEKFGKYQGLFNICAGSVEPYDKGCFLAAIIRELREEFKIDLNWRTFDYHFKNRYNQINYFMHYNTAIFVGNFDGLDERRINDIIIRDNATPLKPFAYKELSKVEFFRVRDIRQLKNTKVYSTFAIACINKLTL